MVGVDVDREELKCYLQGRRFRTGNNRVGYSRVPTGRDVTIVLEATSTYSVKPAAWFSARGCQVKVVSPNVLAREKDPRRKSDYNDAEKLASMEGGPFVTSDLRELVSYLEFVDDLLTRCRNRFQNLLLVDDGRVTREKIREIARGEYAFDQEYVKLPYAEAIYELRELAALVLELQERRERLVKEMEKIVPDHAIFTIPGIGAITGAVILARVVDFSRFPSAESSVFCGLDPVVERSGSRTTSRGISKRGDRYLRKALYMAALAMIANRNNPVITRFYDEHRDRLRGKKMVIACARKLARIVWSVGYHNRPFEVR
ncbi:MAG: IS110 family transposase ISSto6 [Metallosphaera javensis (ex Sakai et al. 2022)]|nr:MAG: IS110 family transposase ISSto6 [Metallosphaera javensis (ex Sakai et al. 2022)]